MAVSGSALDSNPQDAEMLYGQSFDRLGFAAVLDRLGKHAQAMDQLQHAIKVLENLSQQDSGNISARRLLGVALQRRAAHRLLLGEEGGTEPDLQNSERVLSALYEQEPNNLTLLRDLADCYSEMGSSPRIALTGRTQIVSTRKSLELWKRWPRIGKSSVYDQRQRQLAAGLVRQAGKHLPNASFR